MSKLLGAYHPESEPLAVALSALSKRSRAGHESGEEAKRGIVGSEPATTRLSREIISGLPYFVKLRYACDI